MSVYVVGKKSRKAKVIGAAISPTPALTTDAHERTRFYQFWDFMDTIKIHGYMRAAMGVIGRSAVGAWWAIRRKKDYPKQAADRQRRRLIEFYNMWDKPWDNIKDYQSMVFKIMIAAMYLRYFGQAAFHILRNKEGSAIGMDFLPGYVVPNVDRTGKFKSPAFTQYLSRNPSDKVEFTNQRDIVYITNPDWEGFPTGASDVEALGDFALPLDLYLQLAAREYMKNRDRPEVIYELPEDISDEAFDAFVALLDAKYRGAANLGKSPIAVQGSVNIKEMTKLPSDLPYQQAREDTREETLAVTGVSGAKMGITSQLASANMKEVRREFHETTMVPLFKLIEAAFYEQIHVREFGFRGWEFKFNNPDFLNAVERATVHLRYKGMSVLNSNEIRYDLGLEPREGEFGDMYDDEIKQEKKDAADEVTPQGNQGSPPEGRTPEPDDPSQTGEPNDAYEPPLRGDQHDEEPRAMLSDLHKWRDFAINRLKKGRSLRPFESENIPLELRDLIQSHIEQAKSIDELRSLFEDAETKLEEML